MYTISKEFHCCCSHQLHGLKEGHPCGRMHGHNYVIIVELKSETVDDDGFVTDYGELKPIKEYIDKKLDHRHLNHIMPVNPTAENIAEHLFWQFKKQFPKLSAVIVKETPKTEARYEPS